MSVHTIIEISILVVGLLFLVIFAIHELRLTNRTMKDNIELMKRMTGEFSEVRCSNCCKWVPTGDTKGFCRELNVTIDGKMFCNVWERKKGNRNGTSRSKRNHK